ncbi:type III pantothenate kinase [Aureibacillus halotolerans]|uniref:Type III pantothenate kinase n=1 Tax=Aureibacillus halotolerans TaxID=1508390 RepID=A0A4R6TTW0_9BACI|nr:type III pantothenate kinase [Aureibacillus halotolerans]TDQ34210.1 pantothenate kinase [Aureibacillus halotolerans]
MIVVIDVGNTHVVIGVCKGKDIVTRWRLSTDVHRTEDEYCALLRSLFQAESLTTDAIRGVILATVVPPMLPVMQAMSEKLFGKKALVVGPGVKTGLNVKYDNPKEVGADRVVNAVAAICRYGTPLIVVDFGTATTFCYINEKKHYLGGVIIPGVQLAAEALFAKASKLPRTELVKPSQVIGRNTNDSLQSGLYYGGIGQVEGIVQRMMTYAGTGKKPKVIATGGLSTLLRPDLTIADVIDPDLTLKGLLDIFYMNEKLS